MDPARLIALARLHARLTQAELASRAGTSQAAVARYESGTTSPSVRTLDRLLHAAGKRLVLTTADTPHVDASALPIAFRTRRSDIIWEIRKTSAQRPRVIPPTKSNAAVLIVDPGGVHDLYRGRLAHALQIMLEPIIEVPFEVRVGDGPDAPGAVPL